MSEANQSQVQESMFSDIEKNVPRLLTAPPTALPTNFLGREKELADIRNLLTSQNTLALVNAEGGMGKTTLAARYWQEYENQYQHLAWLFCENGILAAMRDQLPYALGLVEALAPYAYDPEKQALIIKTAMAALPKDCLLVLDNANQEEHILGFQKLMSGLGWHVLITSRCSKVLPDNEYKITGLPPAQAKALFKEFHDEKTPEFETLLQRFLIAVDYNTLCIEVFSKNLREGAGWGLTFETLLQKLETNGLFMGEHSFEIQTEWANSTQKVALKSTDQVIEALYNVADQQQSQPELHDLLCTFALLPAENHPPQVLGELLTPDDKPGLKRQLDQLAQKGWLSTDRNTYRISPVVQKILLQQNVERRWELGKPLVLRLQAVFETEGYHSKNIATAGPFAELVLGLIDNLNVAEENLALLFNKLWVYHTATGNLAKAMETAEKMQKFCEAHDFKHALGISFSKLGETHSALGNLPQALTFFEQYNALEKELHNVNPHNVEFKNGLAISYEKLGSTHSELGNLPQALTFFEQYNALEKELHEAYPQNVEFKNGLAISYEKLGETHSALGNLQQALTFFEERSRLGKELHEAYPQNVEFKNGLAISYEKLGSTHSALGNVPQALTFFEERSMLGKELHEAYPQNVEFKNGLAISYEKLGSTHSALGNVPQALTFFEERSRLGKELHEAYPQNVSFKNGLAISYEKLGSTHSALGNLQQALTFFEQYNQFEKEFHEAYPKNVELKNGLAISYEKLGETHSALGNVPQALTFFEERSRLGKELHEAYPQNVDFKNGLAISYSKLGSTHSALGNLPQALTFFEQYNQLEKELHEAYPQNVSFKNGLAISYEKLGETHSALGDLPQALTFFERYTNLRKELYEAYPQNFQFKNGFAISNWKLGETYISLDSLDKALTYFEVHNRLTQELYKAHPHLEFFKTELDNSLQKIDYILKAQGKYKELQMLIAKNNETALLARFSAPGPKYLLAIEGGGAEILARLALLAALETRMKQATGNSEYCLADTFDLIGGAGLGNLVAMQLSLGKSSIDIFMFFGRAIAGAQWRIDDAVLRQYVQENTEYSIWKTGFCYLKDAAKIWSAPLTNHPEQALSRSFILQSELANIEGEEVSYTSLTCPPQTALLHVATHSDYPFGWPIGEENLHILSIERENVSLRPTRKSRSADLVSISPEARIGQLADWIFEADHGQSPLGFHPASIVRLSPLRGEVAPTYRIEDWDDLYAQAMRELESFDLTPFLPKTTK